MMIYMDHSVAYYMVDVMSNLLLTKQSVYPQVQSLCEALII